jgi:hypothetical protein
MSDEPLFHSRDHAQMAALGIAAAEAARHVDQFRQPPPFTQILRPCRLGDGIRRIEPAEEAALAARFARAAATGRVSKLVPASGAASRMFQALITELERSEEAAGAERDPSSATPDQAGASSEVEAFFANLPRFAFCELLAASLRGDSTVKEVLPPICGGGTSAGESGGGTAAWSSAGRHAVLRHLLTPAGLDYAERPKGLILFHRYPEGPRTPFEEHLVEAIDYARDAAGLCRLHFTVSPQHEAGFGALLSRLRPRLERRHGARFEVSFSTQRRATDTLAVDEEHRPFRLSDGSLLFRPGGHGALIANLQELADAGADLVLLKNIDNVVPDRTKPEIGRWKTLLTGLLLRLEEGVAGHLAALAALAALELDRPAVTEDPGAAAAGVLASAAAFVERELCRPLNAAGLESFARRRRDLIAALDRPLRVCGVVRNAGEPGGGPFWVRSPAGEVSLQIVETSQIDPGSPEQQAALAASTHFNPVDISCAVRDHCGRPFDLSRFIDPATVFIARKSHEGRPLKALERPGLWNGAMAGWNTVFVEVPDSTFAPVKTVLDLLRPEHQAESQVQHPSQASFDPAEK